MNNLKKVLLGIGFVGIVAGCTVGVCLLTNPKEVQSVSEDSYQIGRCYHAVDAEFQKEAQINFDTKTQTFRYYPSVVSSAVLTGTYEVLGAQIVMTADYKDERLVFRFVEDALEFDKTESSLELDLDDGTVFQGNNNRIE